MCPRQCQRNEKTGPAGCGLCEQRPVSYGRREAGAAHGKWRAAATPHANHELLSAGARAKARLTAQTGVSCGAKTRRVATLLRQPFDTICAQATPVGLTKPHVLQRRSSDLV